MRPANSDVKAYLAANRNILYTDVYTFELRGGTDDNYRLRYTSGQRNLTAYPVNGDPAAVTYRSDQVIITGLRMRASIGLEVDEQTIDITPMAGALVQGLSFQSAARRRVFDGATLRRDRYFFETFGAAPIGGVPMFVGLVSTFEKVGRTSISLKVKAANVLLDQPMPRHLWQPRCLHNIFDAGCTLIADDFAVHGEVEADATASFIPWTVGSTADFTLGKVFFENMGNVGEWRTIRSADAAGLTLAYPLPEVPAEGDLFTAYPGCDGSKARCTALSNLDNFRAFPFVPQATQAI